MRSVKKLFFTTLALTLTGLIMRTVGVWFNVYLTKLVGTAGIGIFQLILSVYAMAKTLAYAGMNLGATRLCIDDCKTARHSMRRILLCALITGVFANTVLFGLSQFISRVWIHSEDAVASLRVLSFSLPFVALSAALNGYMTAVRKMGRYSVIQLGEQLCRIIATVLMVGALFNGDQARSIFLVSAGITISEVFSFSLCLFTFLFDVKKNRMQKAGKTGFLKRFCRIAVPDAVGAYVRSALNTIEHLLIPWGIRRSGVGAEKAFSAYGIVQGMALPVVLYPSAVLGVVSSLLVPEIAECMTKRNLVEIRYIISRVLQITSLFSIAVATALFLYAEPFSVAVFHSTEAKDFLLILAPLVPIMYMDMTTDGMLKGLDQQISLMRINVLDSVLCVALVYFLVPKTAVSGYIITIYAAEIINFLLSFRKLNQIVSFSLLPIKNICFPALIGIASFLLTRPMIGITKDPTPGLILSCGIGSLVYVCILRVTKCLSKEDITWAKRLIKPLPSSDSQNGASRPRSSFASDPGSGAARTRRISRSRYQA